jgi:hypothetical protein
MHDPICEHRKLFYIMLEQFFSKSTLSWKPSESLFKKQKEKNTFF